MNDILHSVILRLAVKFTATCSVQKLRKDIFPAASGLYGAPCQNHDLISDIQNAFLVGNDDQGIVGVAVQFLKYLDQIVEAPEINPCLRLVEDGQRSVSGDNGGDLGLRLRPG